MLLRSLVVAVWFLAGISVGAAVTMRYTIARIRAADEVSIQRIDQCFEIINTMPHRPFTITR